MLLTRVPRAARLLPSLLLAAMWGTVAGCAANYPVLGKFAASDEFFRGRIEATTITGRGRLEAVGDTTRTRCVGTSTITYAPPGHAGTIVLRCQDGRRVVVNYTVTGWARGHGAGADQYGNRFAFTFGMSDPEAEKYIRTGLSVERR